MNAMIKLYGLIGYPLSHSFSKKYFTEKFEKENIAGCSYELFSIESIGRLREEVLNPHPELCGLNVTIPYKKDVIPFLDDVSALPLQACNCIKIFHGQLKGFNTDIVGFEQSLCEKLLPYHSPALVLGTGGAAEAVIFVLQKLGISYKVVSRQAAPGVLTYAMLTSEMVANHKLIINCSPVGTYPKEDEAPDLPYEAISAAHYLFDLVYNPAETRFLMEGAQRGATIKNGMDMLANQAEESWRIWNDPTL
jgi:shikimate dehydrogenase